MSKPIECTNLSSSKEYICPKCGTIIKDWDAMEWYYGRDFSNIYLEGYAYCDNCETEFDFMGEYTFNKITFTEV